MTRLAPDPQKTLLEPSALEVLLEFPLHIRGHRPALRGQLGHERRAVLLDQLIEQGLLRAVALIALRALAQTGFPASPPVRDPGVLARRVLRIFDDHNGGEFGDP